jgi:predicted permease
MRWVTRLRLRLRTALLRQRVDAELDEELRYHLDRQIEALVARGLPPGAARDAALRDMGGLARRTEECREARGLAFLESVLQDARYAARALRRTPGFTAVAVLSLGLGIGANTTIFAFLDAVALRPLPYPGADRIVVFREAFRERDGTVNVHPFNYLQWQAQARSFEALALVQTIPVNIAGAEGAEQVSGLQTTAGLFEVFGVAPAIGRFLAPEEVGPSKQRLLVLGHRLWQRSFGADAAVLGRQIVIASQPYTVIGVAPPGFRVGLVEPDLFAALPLDPAKPDAIGSRSFQCYGRLKAGVTLAAAGAEIAVISDRLAREYPVDKDAYAVVFGLHDYVNRESRPMLWILMGVVGAVLLIACVNLAGLLLTRGVSRRGELALRASLGASRFRIVRQLVVESLVLSLAGGALGIAIGWWCTRLLVAVSGGTLTFEGAPPIRLDLRVVLFAAALALVTGLVFGALPAWQSARANLLPAMKDRGRAGAESRRTRLRDALVIGQMALAVTLLVGAGLLLRTFSNLTRVDLGFRPAGVITMGLFLGGHDTAGRVGTIARILEQVGRLPGVDAAGTIRFVPISGFNSGTGFRFADRSDGAAMRDLTVAVSVIDGAYLSAMGIPLIEGRAFAPGDRLGTPGVVLVNRAFSERFVPEGRAIGRRLSLQWEFQQAPAEVVGIVGDVRHNGLTSEPEPTVFVSHAQAPSYITSLVVRTTGDPSAYARTIRSAIQQVDRTQAAGGIRTMTDYVEASLERPRLYALFLAAFAGLALILGGIGVYGVVAYAVTERTHELGVRMALGAPRTAVVRMVVGHGAVLALVGLGIGSIGALSVSRLASHLFFGVTPTDGATYAAALAVLMLLVCVATYLPARRASRIDPVIALRHE